MEVIIATILTSLIITTGIIVAVNSEVRKPVGTRERIVTLVEQCIIEHKDNTFDCYFIKQQE